MRSTPAGASSTSPRWAERSYRCRWQWSIDHKWDFWRAVWDDAGILGVPGERVLEDAERMPGARWFPDARLNYARNLLERRPADDTGDAMVFWGEDRVRRRLSHADVHALASAYLGGFSFAELARGGRVEEL